MPSNPSKLNPHQRRVLELYLAEGKRNGAKCYREVYPGCKTDTGAQTGFSRLLRSPAGKAFMEQRNQELAAKLEISQSKILAELAAIGFVDPADIFRPDGTAKPIHQIPERARRAITGVKVIRHKGRATVWEYRLLSKNEALRMLGENQRMFVQKAEVSVGTHEQQLSELEDD